MAERRVTNDPVAVHELLERVLTLLKEEHFLGSDGKQPVVRFQHPSTLRFETLNLQLGELPENNHLLKAIKAIIHYSVNTQHPLFLNQLYGGLDPYGLAGAWITEALNTNQYTFEVAPAFTITEMTVLEKTLSLFHFSGGDGIFTSGGSMANMLAMVLARYKMKPETKTKGLFNMLRLVAFISEDSHYSIMKAANWLGIGTENVISVKTDDKGRMIPSCLKLCIENAIKENKQPFFVNMTAGTTVLGAFDPFNEIVDVCQGFSIWLHVDACWGGSLIFSKKYCSVLQGVERAHSISWNPHKMLGAPLQCSVFILKEKGLLHKCNSASATYLFQQDKFYDTNYDTGDKSVQCGRKPDAFKLWVMWRARGDDGFAVLVDNAMDMARYFQEKVIGRPGFRLVMPEFQCTNICFWYIPESLRDQEETDEWWQQVDTVAPRLKECMILSGTLMIGYQPLKHRRLHNFFRLVTTCHPVLTKDDMDRVIEEIETKGAGLVI